MRVIILKDCSDVFPCLFVHIAGARVTGSKGWEAKVARRSRALECYSPCDIQACWVKIKIHGCQCLCLHGHMRPIYNSQEKMFGESGREKKAFTLDNTYCKWGGYLEKEKMKKRGGEKKRSRLRRDGRAHTYERLIQIANVLLRWKFSLILLLIRTGLSGVPTIRDSAGHKWVNLPGAYMY